MNEYEIEQACERFAKHPVLGPASRFLQAYAEEVNQHSDGWPYWTPPSRAASKLMDLIHGQLRAGMGSWPVTPAPTADDIKKALTPIKRFMTTRGNKAGMSLPRLEI